VHIPRILSLCIAHIHTYTHTALELVQVYFEIGLISVFICVEFFSFIKMRRFRSLNVKVYVSPEKSCSQVNSELSLVLERCEMKVVEMCCVVFRLIDTR
jgi:hypothetical protein